MTEPAQDFNNPFPSPASLNNNTTPSGESNFSTFNATPEQSVPTPPMSTAAEADIAVPAPDNMAYSANAVPEPEMPPMPESQPTGFGPAADTPLPPTPPSEMNADPSMPPIQDDNKMKKQKMMLIVIAGLFIVGLSVLGYFLYGYFTNKAKPSQTVTLTYWGLWESKENMQPLIDEYEKSHNNVKIEYEERSPEFYFETLQSRLGKDNGPDIVRIHNTWVKPLLARLSPLPNTIMDKDTYTKTFYKNADNTLKEGTSYYGIPLMYDGLALVYNDTLFQQENIKQPPKTWEEFRDYAKRLTKYADVDINGKKVNQMVQAGAAIGYSNIQMSTDLLGLLMAQNGVEFFDAKGNINFDKSMSVDGRNLGAEALSFYSMFSKDKDRVWNKDWPSASDSFAEGKVGMMFVPSWRIMNLLEANKNLKIKVASVPQIPLSETENTNINWTSYWAEAVSKTAKDQAAAWDFLKYLSEREQLIKFYTQASERRLFGEPYPRQDLYSSLSSDPYLGTYVKEANTAVSFPMCDRTYDSKYNDAIKALFQTAIDKVNGGESAETVIADTAKNVKKAMDAAKVK